MAVLEYRTTRLYVQRTHIYTYTPIHTYIYTLYLKSAYCGCACHLSTFNLFERSSAAPLALSSHHSCNWNTFCWRKFAAIFRSAMKFALPPHTTINCCYFACCIFVFPFFIFAFFFCFYFLFIVVLAFVFAFACFLLYFLPSLLQ